MCKHEPLCYAHRSGVSNDGSALQIRRANAFVELCSQDELDGTTSESRELSRFWRDVLKLRYVNRRLKSDDSAAIVFETP